MNNKIKHPKGDRILLRMNNILLGMTVLLIVVPLLYVFLSSFLEPNVLIKKGLNLSSSDWSLEGYKRILTDGTIMQRVYEFDSLFSWIYPCDCNRLHPCRLYIIC